MPSTHVCGFPRAMEKSDKRMRLKAAELKDPRGHVLGCKALWPPVSLDSESEVSCVPPEASVRFPTGTFQVFEIIRAGELELEKCNCLTSQEMPSIWGPNGK